MANLIRLICDIKKAAGYRPAAQDKGRSCWVCRRVIVSNYSTGLVKFDCKRTERIFRVARLGDCNHFEPRKEGKTGG